MARERTQTFLIDDFNGGLSEGSRRGIKGSYRAGIGIDYRRDPDTISALRKLTKESDSTVDGLILWMVEAGTDIYMLANNGDLYKRTSTPVYSLIHTFSGCSGEGLAFFNDYIYVAGATSLHRYGPISGTPAVEENFLVSENREIDQGQTATTNTYTIPTSVSETSANKLPFTPTVDNISGIMLRIVATGTGSLTVIIHDNSDNVVVQKTFPASYTSSTTTRQRFMFGGSYALTPSASYHIHVISTVADTTVRANTASNLSTAEFATFQFLNTEDVDQSRLLVESSTATPEFTLGTTVNEGDARKIEFIPEKSNINGVSVLIRDPGSGDWTVRIHDDRDNLIASSTVTNANLKASKGWQKFPFSTVNIVPTATYHIHVNSTVANGIVNTATADDLSAAYYRTHYQILNDADYHPMKFFPGAGGLVIGNGNFLAFYDGTVYREPGSATGSEKLKFAMEEEVRAIDLVGDLVGVGTWKGNSIGDHGEGTLYLWDGTTIGVNAFKTIPGEINALLTGDDGLMNIFAGGRGDIYIYNGTTTLAKTRKEIDRNSIIEVLPGAVTNWEGVPRFALSSNDTNEDTNIPRVVYSYGSKSKNYPRSLGADYPISTGSIDADVRIGALLGLGPRKLLVAWDDGGSYGVDLVSSTADQASVTFESLIFDDGRPDMKRKGRAMRMKFDTLTTGQTITLKYKVDQESTWQTLGTVSYASDGPIDYKSFSFDKYFHELETQITLATSGTTGPTLRAVVLKYIDDSDILDNT